MKRALVVLVLLGGVSLAEDRVREVKAEKGEVLALAELRRRREDLNEAMRKLEAEAVELVAEISSHHALGPHERLAGFDQAKGVFLVAATSSASPAAVSSR